jgi:EAL domain-containing protein (putative c-di-GMP-specific phosphodiesterase class I)
VFTDASIGVAVSSADHRSADDLVRDADLAMSRAKQAGRGGYAIFDDALHQAAVTRLQLETELRRALERREFRVWYQPVVSLVDSRVVGFEALVRWQHPDRGLLQPVDFLSVAEEVGLVGPIDEWVMGEACRQGRTWMDTDPRQLVPVISVNVSANAFRQEGLVRTVTECLRATRFPAHGLRVEITEGVAIQDAQRALAVLTDLHALGVRVSLDDFGTGYCSLSYLHSLPVDTLKIDRSFVARIGAGTSQGEIIKLIMGLARTLGVSVVAEGTETSEQVAYLDALGCKFGQGYYFAGPMPPDDAHALLWTILVAPERVAAAC